MIDKEVIDKLLDMSRLEIREEHKGKFVAQMQEIVGYIETIGKMDTSAVTDRESVFDEKDVVAEDLIQAGLSQPELRKYTKNYLDGYYAVPKILSKDN